MLSKRIWLLGALIAAVAVAASLVGASVAPAKTLKAAGSTVKIWTDKDRLAATKKIANAWAKKRGVNVEVVEKGFGNIRDDLGKVKPDTAPDVIMAAHDWTGELAANGLVKPLFLKKKALKLIPQYARKGFSYGKGNKASLYGMPVALENIGLFVNTKLTKVPKTFAQVEKRAVKFQKKGGGRIGLAVQQGSGGDAYHMYPFFSGLCGYIFKTTKGGALNPHKIGVANSKFIKNAKMIDRWNKERFVNSKVDYNTAMQAFTTGKALYWMTGPWAIDTIRGAGIKFKVVQLPLIKCHSVPFLGVQGLMVTKFASGHGVASAAKDFVGSYMAGAGPQFTLAQANGRYPANIKAGKRIKDPALRQIGQASKGGVPMPNIPQMASVWGDLGTAWVKSTKGAGATPAKKAFKQASANIKKLIGGGS